MVKKYDTKTRDDLMCYLQVVANLDATPKQLEIIDTYLQQIFLDGYFTAISEDGWHCQRGEQC